MMQYSTRPGVLWPSIQGKTYPTGFPNCMASWIGGKATTKDILDLLMHNDFTIEQAKTFLMATVDTNKHFGKFHDQCLQFYKQELKERIKKAHSLSSSSASSSNSLEGQGET